MNKNLYPILMLMINYFSAVYLVTGAVIFFLSDLSAWAMVLFVISWIYLIPPLICRLLITLFGRPVGTVDSHSLVFMHWWFLTQLQILYVRFKFSEELLRVFPGLYSLWLNLWGGRISLLTYWSPAVTVTDRYHLTIGKGTIVGGGCVLGAHSITAGEAGCQQLILAPIIIESQSVIGAYAKIGPGCHVYANQTVPAGKILKPFYSWKDGKVQRPATQD